VHYRPAHHQSAVPPQFDAMGTNIAHTSAVAPPLPPLGDHGLAAFRPGGLSGIPAYQGSFTQVVNTGQPLMAVPGTPTASSQTSTRLGHPSPMSGAVPSATGTCQNSNALVIERYFNEMLNESPRHPNEPRIAHEPAEAMSIWGRTGQEQQVGGPRPPVSDTIAHVGEHPSLGPDRRQWQFVQHDGVSRPVASQPTHRRGPRDRDAYKKTRGVGACISCKIKRGSKKAGNVSGSPPTFIRFGQLMSTSVRLTTERATRAPRASNILSQMRKDFAFVFPTRDIGNSYRLRRVRTHSISTLLFGSSQRLIMIYLLRRCGYSTPTRRKRFPAREDRRRGPDGLFHFGPVELNGVSNPDIQARWISPLSS
jgi:hypothetical protein